MIRFQVSGFDWDDGNRDKAQKHGMLLDEIEQFFEQDILIAPDEKHSQAEVRYLGIGRASDDRPMLVVFALRTKHGKTLIRPISARYMHAKEAERYNEESTKIQDLPRS